MVKGWAADITPLYDKEIYIKLNEHTDIETLLDENIVYLREQGFLRGNNPLIKIEHPLTDTLKSPERGGMESVGEVEEEIQTSEGNSV